MSKELNDTLAALNPGARLKDLPFGPSNPTDPLASWAVGWSHYIVAGDAKTGGLIKHGQDQVIIGNRTFTGENTLGELMAAIKGK